MPYTGMRYWKRSESVDAFQWRPDVSGPQWFIDQINRTCYIFKDAVPPHVEIRGQNGVNLTAHSGDYIFINQMQVIHVLDEDSFNDEFTPVRRVA